MPTGATSWTGTTGTTGWTAMPVTADHWADIHSYAIGWTWSGAPSSVFGTLTSGTGKFGFTVFKNIAGSQTITVDENFSTGARVRYRVVITNPTTITDHTLPRLIIELQALGYSAVNPLPTMGSKLFGGLFGTATGLDGLQAPFVKGIQYEPEGENDPSVWIITYTVSPLVPASSSNRPDTGSAATKPNAEEAPWTIGPDMTINFSTEDFVLGLGRFVGTKTPSQLDSALQAGTYASAFGETGGTFEMVVNSAGHPLESPPPMKVGTAAISINRAFETLPAGMAAALNGAIEEVCSSSITVNGVTFAAYTCKLNGGSIANKRWKKHCDWLPKQRHPLGYTYTEVGWTPPAGKVAADVAVNYTRNNLPAFEYVDYQEVSVSVAQRDLGWGYALIDKGYMDINKADNNEFSGRQTHVDILENGVFIDTSSGTADKSVLRLYQVQKTGTALTNILEAMLD